MANLVNATFQPDAGFLTDTHVSSSTRIDADKLQHCQYAWTNFALAIGGTPATREELVIVPATSGVFRAFQCVLTDSGTSTSITFDCKKNGVSILSSTVSYVHGDGDGTVKNGTISTTTYAAGDRISIAMTVSSATGAQGPYAHIVIEDANAP